MRSTKTNIANKIGVGVKSLINNILPPPRYFLDFSVMPNLFRHLCPKENIPSRWLSGFIGMTFIVMLNSFQHLYHMEKIPTRWLSGCVGMTSIVMPNLFRHLCPNEKIPSRWLSGCVGMTGFVVRTRLIASLREPLNNLKLRKLKTKYN